MKLKEYRCPKCQKNIKPGLLFKAYGSGIIEAHCPKCRKLVTVEFDTVKNNMDLVAAND